MNFKTLAQRTFKIKYFFGSNQQKLPKILEINPNLTNPDDFPEPFANNKIGILNEIYFR